MKKHLIVPLLLLLFFMTKAQNNLPLPYSQLKNNAESSRLLNSFDPHKSFIICNQENGLSGINVNQYEKNKRSRFFSSSSIGLKDQQNFNHKQTIYDSNELLFSQNPDWKWVSKANGISLDQASGYSITSDNMGNEYVTGQFHGIAIVGTDTLISNGWYDIFVSKYNANGQMLWTQHAGGEGADFSYGITVDNSGNVYITGSFGGYGTYGSLLSPGPSMTIGSTTLTSSGGDDIFVAKLNSAGIWQWAQKAGGTTSSDIGRNIIADNIGNIYVTGFFGGTAVFNSISYTAYGGPYDVDIFVAKYNSSGILQWVKTAGGNGGDYSYGINFDKGGNILLTGAFSDTAYFNNIALISKGGRDIFIANCSPSGIWQWANGAGGSGDDAATAISIDTSGSIYTTGSFQNTANWGALTQTSNGQYDIFVAKSNSTGIWQWVQKAGGTKDDLCYGNSTDPFGNCYVAGCFYGTSNFGGTVLTVSGQPYYSDAFICKYNSDGLIQWVKQAGGPDNDVCNAICTNSIGNICITGYFNDNIDFGLGQLHCNSIGKGFIVNYNNNGICSFSNQIGGDNRDDVLITDLARDGNGNIYAVGRFTGKCQFGNTTLISDLSNSQMTSGYTKMFIAKMDSFGIWEWAQMAGQSQTGGGLFFNDPIISIDQSGNIYMAGDNNGTIFFGNQTSTINGGFVAKCNSSGICKWVKKVGTGGNPDTRLLGISCDPLGNIFMSGWLGGVTHFGNHIINPIGNWDIFISKYDSGGICQWVKNIGGVGQYCTESNIVSDNKGNCFMTGRFWGNCIFGSQNLNADSGCIFLAKYNSNGTLQWVQQGGGNSGGGGACSIGIDYKNNCYISGYCNQGIKFFGSYSLTYNSTAFIAKCDSSGNWKWAIGGFQGFDSYLDISVDSIGNCYYIAPFVNFENFDSITITNPGIVWDIAVAQCDSSGHWKWAERVGGPFLDYGMCRIIVDQIGNAYAAGNFIDTASFGGITVLGGKGNDCLFLGKIGCFVPANAGNDVNICTGDSIQLSASGGISYNWNPSTGLSCTNCQNPIAHPISSITYAVLVTNANGCTGIDSVTVIVNSLPPIPTITQSGQQLISSSATGNQWYLNNNLIAGATLQSYFAFQTGIYKVKVTSNGCSATSAGIDFHLGVDEITNTNFANIFPNPSGGLFTIESKERNYEIVITNLLGEIIYSSQINLLKTNIDLSNQQQGMFFVRLKSEKGSVTKKLIIQ